MYRVIKNYLSSFFFYTMMLKVRGKLTEIAQLYLQKKKKRKENGENHP